MFACVSGRFPQLICVQTDAVHTHPSPPKHTHSFNGHLSNNAKINKKLSWCWQPARRV